MMKNVILSAVLAIAARDVLAENSAPDQIKVTMATQKEFMKTIYACVSQLIDQATPKEGPYKGFLMDGTKQKPTIKFAANKSQSVSKVFPDGTLLYTIGPTQPSDLSDASYGGITPDGDILVAQSFHVKNHFVVDKDIRDLNSTTFELMSRLRFILHSGGVDPEALRSSAAKKECMPIAKKIADVRRSYPRKLDRDSVIAFDEASIVALETEVKEFVHKCEDEGK